MIRNVRCNDSQEYGSHCNRRVAAMCGGQIASSPIDVLAMLPAGHSGVPGCGGPAAGFPVGQPVVAAVAACVAAWPAAAEHVAAAAAEHALVDDYSPA